jgi:DNA-binding transcriptional LysR family regulator
MLNKTIYDTFIEKLGENKETMSLLGFFLIIEKFGIDKITNVYTENEIKDNLEKINSLNLFFQNNDSVHEYNNIGLCNVEWLKYFITYAQTHNSIEAANTLNITNQGLNKAILGLEKHYKVNLIERNKIAKGLTIPGQFFVEKAQKILENFNDIDKYFKDLKSQEVEGTISIGTFNIGDLFCLDETILAFMKKYNNIYIKVDPLGSSKLEDSIMIGDIDIGITTKKPENKNMEFVKVAQTQYVIVGKPQPKRKWNEFKYLISKQTHNATPSIWPEKYKREIVSEISTRSLLVKLCQKGLGVMTAPEIMVRDSIIKGELAIVADIPFKSTIDLYIIWSKNIYLTRTIKKFISQLIKDFEHTEGNV